MISPGAGSCIEGAFERCSDLCQYESLTENSYQVVSVGVVDGTAVLDGFTVSSSFGHGLRSENGSPTIKRCTFTRNTLYGVYISDGSPTFLECTMRGNNAPPWFRMGQGAGLHNEGADPMLINCVFEGNHVGQETSEGGGMWSSNGDPTLLGCIFRRNTTHSLQGGGLYVSHGEATLLNCVFTENYSGMSRGGGLAVMYGASADVTNCTFTGNEAYPNGGGVKLFGDSLTLANCIFWGNRMTVSGQMAESDQISGANIAVDYSCIQGLTGTLGGVGNIGDDPMFRDVAGSDGVLGTQDDDLRLSTTSPAIDTGDPNGGFAPGTTDLDGHARVLCDRVDMGAYEVGIGDYNCDRTVSLIDFAAWLGCMTGPGAGPYENGCQAFDFEYDDDVDLTDFGAYQRSFATSGP